MRNPRPTTQSWASSSTGVTDLIAVGGAEAALVYAAAVEGGVTTTLVPDRDATLELLLTCLQLGNVVLVKGSHSVGLEDTAMRLTKPDATGITG